jgi:hypothetical protein
MQSSVCRSAVVEIPNFLVVVGSARCRTKGLGNVGMTLPNIWQKNFSKSPKIILGVLKSFGYCDALHFILLRRLSTRNIDTRLPIPPNIESFPSRNLPPYRNSTITSRSNKYKSEERSVKDCLGHHTRFLTRALLPHGLNSPLARRLLQPPIGMHGSMWCYRSDPDSWYALSSEIGNVAR